MNADALQIRFSDRLRCARGPWLPFLYDVELSSRWLRAICRRCRKGILIIELSDDKR
jgi:hypothetical protein